MDNSEFCGPSIVGLQYHHISSRQSLALLMSGVYCSNHCASSCIVVWVVCAILDCGYV